MKSTAPWSVKGIARDTRETAKEAARKEGLTVGEWLNQIIHKAGSDDMGSVEGLNGVKAADLVLAMDRLNRRFAKGEESTDEALTQITTVLERLETRLSTVENAAGDTGPKRDGGHDSGRELDRIDALRSLEKALGQIAVQFEKSQKAAQDRLAETEGHISAINDGLTTRLAALEAKAADFSTASVAAAPADPDFAERTGKRLRVLGDEIKRGGDQVRSLETLISRLADQIDASEQRSAEGVQRIADGMTALRGQVQALQQTPVKSGPTRADIVEMVEQAADARFAALRDDLPVADFPETGTADTLEPARAFGTRTPDAASLFDAASAFDAPADQPQDDPASAHTPEMAPSPIAPTGSLYDDPDDEEISVDTEFASAFDDLDLDVDQPPTPLPGEETPPAATPDDELEVDLDSEADEARRIAAEINQALNGGLADDRARDGFDAPGETVAPPRAGAPVETVAQPHPPADDPQTDQIGFAREEAAPARQPQAAPKIATQRPVDPARINPGKLPRTPEGKIDIARLTPKQKAILAARARKKREEALAAAQATGPASEAAPTPAPKRARPVPIDTPDLINDEQKSILENVRSFFSRGRSNDDGDEQSPISDAASAPAGEPGAVKKKSDLDTSAAKADRSQDGATLNQDGQLSAEQKDAPRPAPTGPVFLENVHQIDTSTSGGLLIREGKPTLFGYLSLAAIALMIAAFVGLRFFLPAKPPSPARERTGVPTISIPADASLDNAGIIETPAPAPLNTNQPRLAFLEAMTVLSGEAGAEDIEGAVALLETASAAGYAPAQFQLGEFYKNGTYVDQNPGRARSWFQRAASGGNVFAMHRLGYLYAEGQGGSADINTAIQWFEDAANFGFVDSMFNLGTIYDPITGNSLANVQDAEKAYYWYALAALQGDNGAANKAGDLATRLDNRQKTRLDAEIENWRARPTNRTANENIVSE
ncbi:MAG: hypothetical protein AAFQ29_11480 [Pseudomonadota bacterium]